MANSLVSPADLAEYPGAPFTQPIVDAAAATVRLETGWHIAPLVTETATVTGYGGSRLILPTLNVVAVTQVRDVSGSTSIVLSGWRRSRIGILTRPDGWPCGHESVEVDLTHGYPETPVELLPVIADFCRAARSDPRVTQERLGAWSASFRASLGDTTSGAVLDRFTIRTGF